MKQVKDVNDIINDCEFLSYDELILLNNNIVHMLKSKKNVKDKSAINNFNVGDRVSYEYKGDKHIGIIVKKNQKTISVSENGHEGVGIGIWKVPASWLKLEQTG